MWSLILGSTVYSLENLAEVVVGGYEGVGMAPTAVFLEQGAQQQGGTYRGTRFGARVISLVLWAAAESEVNWWSRRDQLLRLFRPGEVMYLRKTLPNGEIRQINCYYEGGLSMPVKNRKGWSQREGVTLVCPDPFWYDPNLVTVTKTESVDDFNPATVFDFVYEGSADTYPVVMISSTNGGEKPMENPRITQYLDMTPGDVLDLRLGVYAGYSVTFDLAFGVKTVTDSDFVNQISALTVDSDLSTFRVKAAVDGAATRTNSWTFYATSALVDHAYEYTITVMYYKRYLGI